jgi:hypothetical protein
MTAPNRKQPDDLPTAATQLPGGPAPAAARPPANLPPELASHPRYHILRELGRGGMGVVYQARQTMMDRPVAIKVISKALLDNPGALERFHREVKAAAKLSHPNIVTAYDAERAGDLHMLVMEFVPGQSLAELLQKKGPLPVAQACHFVRQAALGLQHAADQGMVHRDIKPQNLMLTPKGQVKILDFGLAKVASERSQGSGLTSANTYMGTPDYSAPEQATDARSADIRADIYSLGCTLYCLLAGEPPFRSETDIKTILAHLEKEATPLPELRPDVPPELWAVVARMLAKDPAKRYQRPAEVAQALAPFCKPGTKATPATPAVSSPARATVTPYNTAPLPGAAKAPARKPAPVAELADTAAAPPKRGAAPAGWWKRPAVLLWLGAGGAVGFVALVVGAVVLASLLLPVKKPQEAVAEVKAPSAPPPTSPNRLPAEAAEGHGDVRTPQAVPDVKPPSPTPAPPPARERSPSAPGGGARPPAPPPPAVDTRAYWAYPNGAFERVEGDVWFQWHENAAVFWRETGRNKDRVEFYRTEPHNNDREVRVHLYRDAGFAQFAGGTWQRWGPFNGGHWAPPPAPTAEPGSGGPTRVGEWVPLFNGRDLAGWKTFRADKVHWSFEGSTLVLRAAPAPDYCLLVTERADYRNFHLRLDTMLGAPRGFGTFFRVGPPRAKGGVMGYMARVAGTREAPGIALPATGSVYVNADHAQALLLTRALEAAIKPGLWFTLDVIADGNHFIVLIDGRKVVDFIDTNNTFPAGRLMLSCPADSIVKFRKVEVKELPDSPGSALAEAAPPPPAGTDPVRENLDKARAEFQAEMGAARKKLLEALDRAEEAARQGGNTKGVDEIKDQREAFAKRGEVPRLAASREYQQERTRARKTLDDAYLAAAAAYTKARTDARAEAVERERRRFDQDVPLDAFQPGTVWKGNTNIVVVGTTEKATIPSALTVLERDGSSFRARFDDGNAIREVHGTLGARGQIAWLARDVRPIQGGPGESHSGKFTDTAIRLQAEWVRPKDKRVVVAVTELKPEKN